MKIGQPKLSENKEPKRGVFVVPTGRYWGPYSRIEDSGLKERKTTLKSAEAISHPLE